MDFDTKASNIILVIFQMKLISQQNNLFQHTYARLKEKLVQMLFVKLYNQFIFNIWLNISSSFAIIWIIFKVYLHFAIYHDNI
jgi:hypothetical protein